MKIPANQRIRRVPQFCLKEWQDMWNICEVNKLRLFGLTSVEFHTVEHVPA